MCRTGEGMTSPSMDLFKACLDYHCHPFVFFGQRMIRSMTAFASAERRTAHGVIECELRAVNHRFLELGLRLPEELRALEPVLRARIGAKVSRGKLDVTVRLRPADGVAALALNTLLVQRLAGLMAEIKDHVPGASINLMDLLQFPGVLQTRTGDVAALQDEVLALLDEALNAFIAARGREGAHLGAAISARVDAIDAIAADIRALLPQIRAQQRSKLEVRLADIQTGDPNRLEQELILALQKLDVDEELDRLASHIVEIRRILDEGEPVGRRLDFLLQEFNREANTLGSKSVDSRTAQAVVELKVLIDQIREQAQNVE